MDRIFYCILGTFVFFLKKNINVKFHKLMIGFAIGVMLAASVWSLIIPSVELAEKSGIIVWIPASVGLILGICFLIFIDKLANRVENNGKKQGLNMLMFSVTIHNIPEGMAVAVCFAALELVKYSSEAVDTKTGIISMCSQNRES